MFAKLELGEGARSERSNHYAEKIPPGCWNVLAPNSWDVVAQIQYIRRAKPLRTESKEVLATL